MKLTSERHCLSRLKTSHLYAQPWLGRIAIGPRKNSKCLQKPMMVETTVHDTCVISIPQQVIDPIYSERVATMISDSSVSHTVKLASGSNSESFLEPIEIFAT